MPDLPAIVAVDFDGTCVDHRFPAVGIDAPGSVAVLRAMEAAGTKLILWTMRSGPQLADAVMWFTRHGIKLWGILENPEQHTWTASPKAYAQLYIDDAAFGCPLIQPEGFKRPCVDWAAVARHFEIDVTL